MIIFLVMGIVGAIIHTFVMHTPFITTLLLYVLIFSAGLQGIFGFTGHYFKSDEVAEYIGWPKGNFFQKEIAYANLAFGILGILCIWLRGNFWLATIIGKSIFLLGAAQVHIDDRIKNKNIHAGNSGIILYMDILLPVILIGLWIAYKIVI
jgi:hypothetical protein